MDAGAWPADLRDRAHEASAALVLLQVEILSAIARAPRGSEEAYALENILEATNTLREAIGALVVASVPA